MADAGNKNVESTNKRPLLLRNGHVFLDGDEVMEAAKISILYQPQVATYRSLREKGVNRRWIGRDITGTLEEYRTTNWLVEAAKKYEETGVTPEFKIQATRDDEGSDFHAEYPNGESVTITGVVLTGDIPLIDLDSEGEFVKDSIAFGAKGMNLEAS